MPSRGVTPPLFSALVYADGACVADTVYATTPGTGYGNPLRLVLVGRTAVLGHVERDRAYNVTGRLVGVEPDGRLRVLVAAREEVREL